MAQGDTEEGEACHAVSGSRKPKYPSLSQPAELPCNCWSQYAVKTIPKNLRNPDGQRLKVLKEVGVLKEVEVRSGVQGACEIRGLE